MRHSIFCFLLLLVLLTSHPRCQAQELYDVETLPTLRTQQYKLGPYEKIIVFSAPRTGSILTYNVCRFLFEDDAHLLSHHNDFNLERLVLRTHIFSDLDAAANEKALNIFLVRNPRNACISNFRIRSPLITNRISFAKQLVDRHSHYLQYSEELKNSGKHVEHLRYEDFSNNLDFLFHKIEEILHISIDSRDKDLMKMGYSKQNISSCIQELPSFNECLPISGFHGQHIGSEEYTPPPNFLYWLDVYIEEVKPLFRKYGYFSNEAF